MSLNFGAITELRRIRAEYLELLGVITKLDQIAEKENLDRTSFVPITAQAATGLQTVTDILAADFEEQRTQRLREGA
jgi:hypothetical protein